MKEINYYIMKKMKLKKKKKCDFLTRAVLSRPQETTSAPFSENRAPKTSFVCPVYVFKLLSVITRSLTSNILCQLAKKRIQNYKVVKLLIGKMIFLLKNFAQGKNYLSCRIRGEGVLFGRCSISVKILQKLTFSNG